MKINLPRFFGVFLFVAILAAITFLLFFLSQNKFKTTTPESNTEISTTPTGKLGQDKPKPSYSITGYVGNVDIEKETVELITFSPPKKTYKVKISPQTPIYQINMNTDSKNPVNYASLTLIDLEQKGPIEVTTFEDPALESDLIATYVRKL